MIIISYFYNLFKLYDKIKHQKDESVYGLKEGTNTT